jgi:RHS repeat-associated protein
VIRINTSDLKYDAENRLVEIKKNSTVIATFTYDGDGKQVKSTISGVTTYYVGQHYQKEGTVVTKFYYSGAERVAMRQGGVVYYIFGDHLGSTAVVKNTQGGKIELRYTAWGTTRYEYGSTPTDRRFTGQREEASFGLYFYNARWYDPALGRFIQADTIIPGEGNQQAWDRYAYANNNPSRYTDPSGNKVCDEVDIYGNCIGWSASFVLSRYGISTQGYNREQQWGIAIAATYSGEKFSQFIPGSSIDAFRKAHGNIIMNFDPDADIEGYCETTGNSITCDTVPGLSAILHEFGHVFDNYYLANSPGDKGLFASNYLPMPRRFEGYKCNQSPCLEHSWFVFPNDPDFEDPKFNFLEEFGDMYMNWVLDETNINPAKIGFTDDKWGNIRRSNMNYYMQYVWLVYMGILP